MSDMTAIACRSAIPVITAVLAIAIEQKVPTKAESMGLMVLTSGVMLAVYEGSGGTPRGIIICIAGGVWPSCCPASLPQLDSWVAALPASLGFGDWRCEMFMVEILGQEGERIHLRAQRILAHLDHKSAEVWPSDLAERIHGNLPKAED